MYLMMMRCRLHDSTRQADRHLDRTEARVADLSHELHQAEQRAKQVRQAFSNISLVSRGCQPVRQQTMHGRSLWCWCGTYFECRANGFCAMQAQAPASVQCVSDPPDCTSGLSYLQKLLPTSLQSAVSVTSTTLASQAAQHWLASGQQAGKMT